MTKPGKPCRLRLESLESREVPATAVLSAGVLTIDGTAQADTITVRQSGSKITVDGTTIRDRGASRSSIDVSSVRRIVVRGGRGDDTIYLAGVTPPAMIWGGLGNDRITAGRGNSTVYGDPGNDTIYGGAGNDHLSGGDGDDVIFGGSGNDWITGDGGNDRLYGDSGDDVIDGGDGKDYLRGGSGADLLNGHGFGVGRADAAKNFDTYNDDFDFRTPVGTAKLAGPLRKGEFDNPGYIAALNAIAATDVRGLIKSLGGHDYDVYLPGDRTHVRVTFDGTWTDNDPMPAATAAPSFAVILLNRARLQSFGIDPARYYSDADQTAQDARFRGKLFDPANALRQFTGRGVSTLSPARADFDVLKAKLDRGALAVAASFRSTRPIANRTGIMPNNDYSVRRLFVDASGPQWVELWNPSGTDANGRLVDRAPGTIRRDDGVVTLSWDDFRRSGNFTTVFVA